MPPTSQPKITDQKKRKSQSPQIGEQPKRRRGRPPKSAQASQVHTPMQRQNISSLWSDDENDDDPVVPRKRKSILQPSGSKYSNKARKATGRRKSQPNYAEPSLSDKSDESEETTPRAEESPITTITNGQQLSALARVGTEKRRSSSSPPPPDFLPRKFLELKVIDYEVPSMKPQGPGDLWTCPFEGCYKRIHKASTTDGKKNVQNHFESHLGTAEDRISLALNESRPYLPVK